MEKMGYTVLILFATISVVDVAMVTLADGKGIPEQYAYRSTNSMGNLDDSGLTDLSYSDSDTNEKRDRFYRKLREYGVPPDVVNQMYPRGLQLGQVTGKENKDVDDEDFEDQSGSAFDPWTIVWYIGSFGGLIAFFLVVSCSEWCCLRNRQARQQRQQNNQQGDQAACPSGVERVRATARTCDTPPPAYHLFAPPSYDSIDYDKKTEKYDIFVVPVHVIKPNLINDTPVRNGGEVGEQVPPPEYSTISMPTIT